MVARAARSEPSDVGSVRGLDGRRRSRDVACARRWSVRCWEAALPVQRELEPATHEPRGEALLEANLQEFAPAAKLVVHERGSAVQSVSCDGLPLAGPVPGHPRILVMGGFGLDTPGLSLAAAEVVAQLIRTGRAEHAAPFSPRRFL